MIQTKDDKASYCLVAQLIEKHLMKVFTDNFAHLHSYFYIMDKLISLHTPDLWDHLKEERIPPVFYASSWFITLFTNTMQFTSNSHLVNWIMDYTVSEGIKGLLKCIIVMLKYLRFKFVKMSFEQIMNFLSDLTKKELFTNVFYEQYLKEKYNGEEEEALRKRYLLYYEDFKFLNLYRERVNSLNVSSDLIVFLAKKYSDVKQKADSKL